MLIAHGRTLPRVRAIVAAACLALLAACGEKPLEPLPAATQAPDFSIPDVNQNSVTAGELISPRSQLGNISAWYFGHAT
ncbi:MAG TPA: hypothetical protein VFQ05_03555 [Candidatus Eisenbacteria bacterium]|nr:hypothetical protein [Candidatus Eisenbacteria bacterium]